MIKNCFVFGFALCALVGAVGCGSSSDLEVVSANGSVNLDGSPVHGVSLRFVPQDGVKGRGGIGMTDNDGRFHAQAGQGLNGLPPGSYRVLLEKLVLTDGSLVPPGVAPIDVDARNSLPEIYNDPVASPVLVTVPADGSDDMFLEISSKYRP